MAPNVSSFQSKPKAVKILHKFTLLAGVYVTVLDVTGLKLRRQRQLTHPLICAGFNEIINSGDTIHLGLDPFVLFTCRG